MREHVDITRTMKTHANTVLRVCSLYFKQSPEREDAFQETFLKYAQSTKEFTDDEHRKAWLITVAANTCKDLLRKAGTAPIPLDSLDESALPANEDAAVFDGPAIAENLARALRALDEKYRIALYMKYYEGYKANEIAAMLGIPENTVYTNLARGREKLKEVLARER